MLDGVDWLLESHPSSEPGEDLIAGPNIGAC